MDPFDPVAPAFSAFRSLINVTCPYLCSDFGFSTLGFANDSVLEISFWSWGDGTAVNAPMRRTDHVWLVQSQHGARSLAPAGQQ
jgi:hypothetical protein